MLRFWVCAAAFLSAYCVTLAIGYAYAGDAGHTAYYAFLGGVNIICWNILWGIRDGR